ncbi:hypothetical protein Q3G72_029556 [Acer saccharum]|nr:hypothetical protein Q3G72_029556 [Acer saccharum]
MGMTFPKKILMVSRVEVLKEEELTRTVNQKRELVIREGSSLAGQKNEGVLKLSFVPEISGGPKDGVGPSTGPIVMEVKGKASEEGGMRDKGEEKVDISLRKENKAGVGLGGVYSKEVHELHGNLSGENVMCTQEDTLVAGSNDLNGVVYNSGLNDGLVKGEKKGKWKRWAREKGNQNASLGVEDHNPKKRKVDIYILEEQKPYKKQNLGTGSSSKTIELSTSRGENPAFRSQ